MGIVPLHVYYLDLIIPGKGISYLPVELLALTIWHNNQVYGVLWLLKCLCLFATHALTGSP